MHAGAAVVFTVCLPHFVIVLMAVAFSMPPSFNHALVQLTINTTYSYMYYENRITFNLTIIYTHTSYIA